MEVDFKVEVNLKVEVDLKDEVDLKESLVHNLSICLYMNGD